MGWLSGIGKAVGGIAGGITGALGGGLSGGMSGSTQSTAQTVNYGLVPGDLVALLPIKGGQNFIVLGKLIYAADFDPSAATVAGGGSNDTLSAAVSLIGGVT